MAFIHAMFMFFRQPFPGNRRPWLQEVAVAMVLTEVSMVMPSQQHSIIAKARRYREEPERLLLVESDPLTVVVNGFHGNHTVVGTPTGLICSCDRFRRGRGQCPHILAVEQRFLDSDKSLRIDGVAGTSARPVLVVARDTHIAGKHARGVTNP